MREIHRSSRRHGEDAGGEVEELLHEVLAHVRGASGEAIPDHSDDPEPPPWLRRAWERIREEYRSPPPVPELAADAGVHPDHVCRAFRRHFGYTMSDLVRRRRVEAAARALRGTDRSLASVAFDAGFSDQSHMTRQMRRYLGITPGELRSARD